MHESALDDVIACADVLMPAGVENALSLVLHIARPVPDTVDWQCSHQITGLPGEDQILTAYGVDSFQALCLCIQMARARLLAMERQLGTPFLTF